MTYAIGCRPHHADGKGIATPMLLAVAFAIAFGAGLLLAASGGSSAVGELISDGGLTYMVTVDPDGDEPGKVQVGDGDAKACAGSPVEVVIPDAIEHGGYTYTVAGIGANAFRECGSLASIDIPDTVETIGVCAFLWCSNLESIELPAAVYSIGGTAFGACTKLESIGVDPENGCYRSHEGALYNHDMTDLIAYPSGRSGECFVPNGVTRIVKEAFLECPRLTHVSLPVGNAIEIEQDAFCYCRALANTNIPSDADLGTTPFISVCGAAGAAPGYKVGHDFNASYVFSEDGMSCDITLTCKRASCDDENGRTVVFEGVATEIDREEGVATVALRYGGVDFLFFQGGFDFGDGGSDREAENGESGGKTILFACIGGGIAILAIAGALFYIRSRR